MKKLLTVVLVLTASMTGAANATIPLLNFKCAGNIDVHADQGGPVYLNGKEAKLTKVNNNYYEAKGSGVTVSISINPDGSPSVSYTGAHGVNGICQDADQDGGN